MGAYTKRLTLFVATAKASLFLGNVLASLLCFMICTFDGRFLALGTATKLSDTLVQRYVRLCFYWGGTLINVLFYFYFLQVIFPQLLLIFFKEVLVLLYRYRVFPLRFFLLNPLSCRTIL